MLKTLGSQIREFKKDSLLTPVFMISEVIMETVIPLLMASIIDDGVEKGDIHHIYMVGAAMVLIAVLGLLFGVLGGKYGARASSGFARNLRKAMYENIQTFSFSNIDKYSTAGDQRETGISLSGSGDLSWRMPCAHHPSGNKIF